MSNHDPETIGELLGRRRVYWVDTAGRIAVRSRYGYDWWAYFAAVGVYVKIGETQRLGGGCLRCER